MKLKGKLHGIYFIVFDNGIKLGMSNDILTRIKTYANPWNNQILSVYVFECKFNRLVESRFKLWFKGNSGNASGEFLVNVSIDTLLSKVKQLRLTKPIGYTFHEKQWLNKLIYHIDINGNVIDSCNPDDL